ncbi:MAG TPA: lipid II flippase MurJ [Candidatus Paceibacterota bacterium]|nr:lipid II flippase MurJ [Candidatus Paceibacterota bacterium]HMP19249.1 lipid II flippase MurJ [Candidatus Paceibacterota bacterium]HMP85538.1 lipid II flippase MurJ [Candidatus Paceibacterota bacterium]
MVEKLVGFLNKEIKGLHEAAYLLAFFTLTSQFLGLIRDRLLASTFGASEILDVYYASFRIPDFLFVLMTSFISASVLVPVLSKNLNNQIELKKIIDSLFSFFILIAIFVSILIFIFIPKILQLIMPNLINGQNSLDLILFSRILLLSPIILGMSQLFGSIVQSYRKFFIYAISPIFYNLGIILGVIVFYPMFGNIGLIYGVVVGLLLHLIVQIPTIIKQKLSPKITFKIEWSIIKEVVFISLPRAITLASTQLILLILVAIASTLSIGSIAIFNFSYNLQSVPMAIIGVSYSMAAFPTLSRLFSNGNKQEFLSHLIIAARHIIFWSFPVVIMFIVLRAQIVRTILGSGQFDWAATRLTAAALAVFAISVVAQSLTLLFVRGYYSAGQTKKPLFINIFSAATTIFLVFIFINLFQNNALFQDFFEILLRVDDLSGTIVLMLPLAFSVGMILNTILLWISFEKDFKGFSATLGRTFRESLFASVVAGYVSYLCLQLLANFLNLNTLLGIFSQGLFSGLIGIFVGWLVLHTIKNNETIEITKALKNRFWKTKDLIVDPEEISG